MNLSGSKFFSRIDLTKAYHQSPVAPEHVPKTAIVTPFDLFEFLQMPFGLRNATQTFQRFINSVLRGLPYAFFYMDDLLIASQTEEQRFHLLCEIFGRHEHHGVVRNVQKCEFGKSSLEFLGHHVSGSGISPLPIKVQAIFDFPAPKSVRQLRRFLGLVNFYRRFLPSCASLPRPLEELLKTTISASAPLSRMDGHQAAFCAIKEALANAPP